MSHHPARHGDIQDPLGKLDLPTSRTSILASSADAYSNDILGLCDRWYYPRILKLNVLRERRLDFQGTKVAAQLLRTFAPWPSRLLSRRPGFPPGLTRSSEFLGVIAPVFIIPRPAPSLAYPP
jgi:hypothetical protein